MTTAISSLIEFLLALLGDEELQADFQDDPEGTLAKYGLDSTCGADIQDIQPMVADHVGVHATGELPHFGDDDPVHGISVITRHYVVHDGPDINNYNYYYVDDNDIIVTIDDRDTVNIHADGDLTISDSFNSDNSVIVIDDSFNQDNDGVDLSGGRVENSTISGRDMADSGNHTSTTTVSDSFNETQNWSNVGNETSTQNWSNVGNDYRQDNDTTIDNSSDDDTVSWIDDSVDVSDSFNGNVFDNDALDLDVSDIQVDAANVTDILP